MTDLQTGRHVHVGRESDFHEHGHHHHHDGHHHNHEGGHHDHDHAGSRTVRLEESVLAKNNLAAERNRGWFAGRNIVALNVMSSPGAGKTTLLERTLRDLRPEMLFCVIEGDQATLNDAERIRKTGCRVVQINTGAGCHLDAETVRVALRQLDPPPNSIVLIENVGNLVCPALFDLGEAARVVVSSVTEGDDKPHKYPHMFRRADVLVLNKMDLLPHVDFSVERFTARARELQPGARLFAISSTCATGLEEWYGWMREMRFRLSNA